MFISTNYNCNQDYSIERIINLRNRRGENMATSENFNKMTDNGFSRRSFLKLGATTVGAAAALGVVG
ncbi:MAG: twin-arginine translocation signal domain-containing protein, partial [Eggerthellaceae bacterium]|nr:twin-arginine translocation signal domain-containing protein [Eggerthellaceae bacterium]